MSKLAPVVFPFYELGEIEAVIDSSPYVIKVDICVHGARFKTTFQFIVDLDNGTSIRNKKIVYFGEGGWLQLPTIEDTVLETFSGTAADVEAVSLAYDNLLHANIPGLLVGNKCTGFIKDEYDRLRSNDDDSAS